MTKRRLESASSRTAAMTCSCRGASYLEPEGHYHSDDDLSVRLLPSLLRVLLHVPPFRRFFTRILAPSGVYQYVIARTKYIDAAFRQALADGFDQILLFGAGYDTRALRFQHEAQHTRIYELDSAPTQQAKIRQYARRGLSSPANLVYIAIDFDKEKLTDRLDAAGFQTGRRSLFVLEGLLMYLEPESVRETFQTLQDYAGSGSRVVFDYVRASVLRQEDGVDGEADLAQTVAKAGEQWRFGLEPDKVGEFVAAYGLELADHKDASELETVYFRTSACRLVGRVNGAHCIVTAVTH